MEHCSLRRRLTAPTAAAAVAVLASMLGATGATGASGSGTVPPRSDFDGPVAAAPRTLDRDVESAEASLRSIACIGARAGTTCWTAP